MVKPSAARALSALLLLGGCKGCTATDPLPPTVVILVLDGVRTDEFSGTAISDLTGMSGEAYAEETWRTVVPDGTIVRQGLNTGLTITAPAHVALLTGRNETFANFPVNTDIGPGLYRPELPTLFEEARAQLALPEDDVVLLANTELLSPVTASLYPGLGEGARYDLIIDEAKGTPANDDTPMFDALLELLDTHPRLVMVNLHDVDRAGHYGEDDAYIEDVAKIDALLADFWAELRTRPELTERLLLFVTTDHGRHRHDEHDGWQNHGDACSGCREVPLLLLGGARAGDERADIVVGQDLAPTAAAWLGIDLPWAEGIAFTEAFEDLDTPVRSGEVDIVAAGEREAVRVYASDRAARSEVYVDDELVSTPGVFAAEAPALTDAPDGPRVCFRELALDGGDTTPWVARCLAGGDAGWTEMGFPDAEVSPFFRAALTERDGRTWVAWPNNPNGTTDLGAEGDIGLAIAAWDATTGWSERLWARAVFPTDTSIVATPRGLVVATTTSLTDPDQRYTRRIRVVPVNLGGASPVADEAVDIVLTETLGEDARPEHAALAADGDTVRLAMLGHAQVEGVGVTSVVALTSEDSGRTWSAPALLPDAGPPFPHLAPAWDGDALVWAVAPEAAGDPAQLCRAAPGDTVASCVALASGRVQSFAVRDGSATVIVDGGVGTWGRALVSW